jgi:DNA replication protein DnaC
MLQVIYLGQYKVWWVGWNDGYDEVMIVAMLDRLLLHSKVFNLSGESFRIKKEKED